MTPLRRFASSPLSPTAGGDAPCGPAQPVPRVPGAPDTHSAEGAILQARVHALVDFYRRVQVERMQGVPILNPALRVEAVGFRVAEGDEAVAEGVLITAWFMSLVRLPLQVQDHGGRVGAKRVLAFGTERFEFIGAHDPALGFHEACALFSPMADFHGQDLARETALAVLARLRPVPAAPRPVAEPVPARRAFLLGRSAVANGGPT